MIDVHETTVDALVEHSADKDVRVATGEPAPLRSLLAAPGVTATSTGAERLMVPGLDIRSIGQVAAEHRVPLYELVTESVSLEEAFMNLAHDAVDYHSNDAGRVGASGVQGDGSAGRPFGMVPVPVAALQLDHAGSGRPVPGGHRCGRRGPLQSERPAGRQERGFR
ncbi:hypothetical protein [Streptomyces sp. NPDC090083]|uniref:hypothetical protein n=1 Tax=Streptomyces sp. NPDC090083 TaxID=3365941 RepID=UPI0038066478